MAAARPDPDAGDAIAAYSWDLNGDGVFGDATTATTSYTYNRSGNYTARLTVTDKHGATGTSTVSISVNNTPPAAVIDTPAACPASTPCSPWVILLASQVTPPIRNREPYPLRP